MKRNILLLCEGPDDIAALREILSRQWKFKTILTSPPPGTGEVRQQKMSSDDDSIEIFLKSVGGRTELKKSWLAIANANSPSTPYHAIGVNFDPDNETEPVWRKNLFQVDPPASISQNSTNDYLFPSDVLPSKELPIIPLPWICPSPTICDLEDSQNLERILVYAARETNPTIHTEIDKWIKKLQEWKQNKYIKKASWKNAARLWHAVLFPDKGVPDLVAQVFGQDAALWNKIKPTINKSTLWDGLIRLLQQQPTP